MKKGKFNEMKTKSKGELGNQIKDLRDKLWNLKSDLVAGKVKNVREVRRIKKLIAVAKTILSENK